MFEPAFQVLCDQQMVLYDPETHFLWLPQFLKYNAPESPNAIRAWESALNYLPECDLKDTLMTHAVAYVKTLSPAFQEALPKTFSLEEAPSENFPAIPVLSVSSSQERIRISASKDQALDHAESSSTNPLNFQHANPLGFIEALPRGSVKASEALVQDLTQGFANACESLAFQDAFAKTLSLDATPSESFPPIPVLPLSPAQEKVRVAEHRDPITHDVQTNSVLRNVVQDEAEYPKSTLPKSHLSEDKAPLSENPLNNQDFQCNKHLPTALPETLLQDCANPQAALQEALPKGFEKTSANPSEGLAEDLRQVFSIQGTKNKEQITKSKEQGTKSKEQEESKIVLENYSEKKLTIEPIPHIVAPARKKIGDISAMDIRNVFTHWKQTLQHPQAHLDGKRQRLIRNALASGYSVSQLCEAINGCAQTPHNLGDNDRGQRYDGLHIILRDADQIDRFIQNAKSPPRPQSAADRLLKTNVMAGHNWLREKLAEAKTYG